MSALLMVSWLCVAGAFRVGISHVIVGESLCMRHVPGAGAVITFVSATLAAAVVGIGVCVHSMSTCMTF